MKVVIDVRVIFKTPFNIGSGALADSLADKPTIKDGAAWPVLPGSSLKGRARHECERIVRTLVGVNRAEQIVCHGPSAETMCPLDPVRLRLDDRTKACPVCQVFGSPWLTAAAQFSDLHWEAQDEFGSERPLDTMIRHGVSISRTRRVAEEQRLFTTETFGPARETVFIGRINGDFPDSDRERYGQVGLLIAGLRAITSLGCGRSRGTGWCRIEARPAEILDGEELAIADDSLKEELVQWLNLP